MSVTAAQGFVAAGVRAGIRRDRKDVALLRASTPATGAAMWTQNRVQAAPVVVSKANLELAQPQAVVVNSGVANAATGAQGIADAIATAEHAAQGGRIPP
jgi:glutamate N-acetyltransferase / amino-acid N-acetyltransferase